MEKYVPLIVALLLGLALTPIVRVLAVKVGAVDYPDSRKVHSGIMPRLGGLAIYLAFTLAVILYMTLASVPGYLANQLWGLLAGSTLIVLVGILDDTKGLSPRVKLAGQIVAALAIVPFGIKISFITNPLINDTLPSIIGTGIFCVPLTVFWVVSVTNAINLIDGLDGLAGGVSSIAALTMAAVAWTQFSRSGIEMVILPLILVAATIGFLRHNFHPAKIFLGDTGSMFLGFSLAAMSIMGLTKGAAAVSVLIPMVILGVPLLDTLFAMLRRLNQHKPIFQPDKEHLHHQLMAMGLSHRQTVLAIYAISIFLGLNAFILNLLYKNENGNQAMFLLFVLAVLVIYLADRVGVLKRSKQSGYMVSQDLQRQRSLKR